VLTAGAVAAVLKVLVDRPRPSAAYRLVAETDPSFPSGHATGTMALGLSAAIVVAVYLLRRPIARALAVGVGVAIPLTVAASRLELGVHWPTDVVAGLALGATVALVTVALGVWTARLPDARRLRALTAVRR
jgi:membrane-associated phospholipid phosphatase